MVARLTPDQKVACSIHVGFNSLVPKRITLFHTIFNFIFISLWVHSHSDDLILDIHTDVTITSTRAGYTQQKPTLNPHKPRISTFLLLPPQDFLPLQNPSFPNLPCPFLTMSLFSGLRQTSLLHRRFSTLLSPDSKPLSAKEKTRVALSLIKTEKNPLRIIDICKAASLSPETHLDRITLSVAVSKLADANHFDVIRQFLEDLKTRPDLRTERFVSHAIVLYGQAKMTDHAVRTFKQCDELGVARSVRVLNSLIFACILAKNYKEVNRVFVEFPKIYGIEPDLDTFNWVIQAFAESGSTSSAYSVMAEMDRKGVKPNSVTFGNLMSGFYREEKLEEVGKVIELMKKYGIRQGLSIYNIRIQSLCKRKRTSEAKGLLDGMISRGVKPNSVTYSHLIYGYCKEGKLDEAKKLFRDMVQRGCKPDGHCYFTLVYFLCQGKDFDAALVICKDSISKNWVPNFSTMKSLVEGLVSVSRVTEARELVSQMKEKFTVNADTWNEIEAGLPQ